MRINGFTQIKSFYSWSFSHQELRIKPHHISLYLFLLNQNNRVNWVEWFKCPFDLAMIGSCISSKKTYYKCLNELQDWKLIKYKKGSNLWKAPLIKLEVLKDTSTVPLVEQVDTPLPEQLGTPLPTHIYKLLTSNKKLVTENLSIWIDDFKRLKKKPDINEFMEYAKEKLSDSDYKLKRQNLIHKYNAWVENNWRDGNDKKIVRWRGKLNQTFPHILKEFKQKENIL